MTVEKILQDGLAAVARAASLWQSSDPERTTVIEIDAEASALVGMAVFRLGMVAPQGRPNGRGSR